jgi:cytochrome c biogenesis protein CcmG/thiol:disulfide interchange protein DsbE
VPETFVISKNGRIAYKHIGAITPEVLQTTILPLVGSLRRGESDLARTAHREIVNIDGERDR